MPIGRIQRAALVVLLTVIGAIPTIAQSRSDPPPGTIAADMKAQKQRPRAGSGMVDVTAVSTTLIAFDKDGRSVLDLRPDELQVLEDGKPVRLLALEPGLSSEKALADGVAGTESVTAGPTNPSSETDPWRVVIYVSTELAGRFVLPSLCRQTAVEASRLTDLGPVDLVLADPTPTLVTEAGRRPEDVRGALELIADDVSGLTTVEQIRTSFTKDFMPGVGFNQGISLSQSSPMSYATQARAAVNRERTVIRGELDRMVAWMQSQPPTARGLLVWMTGGFDLNPADFYIPMVEQIDPNLALPLRTDYSMLSLEEDVRQMVEVALGQGWTVLPINSLRAAFVYGAEVDGAGRIQHHQGVSASAISTQQGDFRHVAPNYPLRIIASSTGGELILNDVQLRTALDRIKNAYLVTYQVDRPADGRLHRLEIRCSRPGVRLRGRQYAASGSLRGVSSTRGHRLLAGEEIGGLLEMEATVRNLGRVEKGLRVGDLGIDADLARLRSMLMPLDLGRIRVTVVVEMNQGAPFVHHQEFDLDWQQVGDVWSFSAPFRWPKKARRAAVVVEELVSSTWGAATIELR